MREVIGVALLLLITLLACGGLSILFPM